ncbi:MAG TPA: translation factor GTPase family protein [Gaiellaceae bacterium]|nr:translation factor GTPase family protein [Gaiellaceae bacterium]
MARKTLNLGILAHVDAGKTTLTERLLYAADVIDEIGSVDKGTTQTDTLALERQRGITIKSAVVSFAIDGVTVNLIDTPGHPDFIAEVERVLSVLDGAVLVVSAVEGVQPQTRVLMRALQRLRVPTLVFVNKIDRAGADDERVLQAISDRLTPAIIPLGSARGLGTRAADFAPWGESDADFAATLASALAEHDDVLLAAFVDDESALPYSRLRSELVAQTGRALVHPVLFGSALTGAGVDSVMAAVAELLPAAEGDGDGPVAGMVFKIERGAAGEKIAFVRMFSGTVRTRDRLRFGGDDEGKVTAIRVFEHGTDEQRTAVSAGEIGKLWGLGEIKVGDRIGETGTAAARHQFAPPTLESAVVPRNPDDKGALRIALAQLAEQDPLIDVRQDDTRQEISVSLYGEVQKEVIQATLADDFGLDVGFRETTTICVERPVAIGEAVEILHAESNPFLATIGLRVDPAPFDSGIEFRLEVDPRTTPLYLFKTVASFEEHMRQYVREPLQEGLFGWQVTDCVVTMTRCTYSIPDGPPSRRGPPSTAADFRKLTPLVVMQALERAGTVVCEPVLRVRLELPVAAIGAVLAALAQLGAGAQAPSLRGELATIETMVPAARVQDLQRQLPGLTGGEGVLESDFGGYQAATGTPPTRRRTTANPLNRAEYLMHLARRVAPGR